MRLCSYGFNARAVPVFPTGANGKSVFLNTIAGVLGGYHRTAAIETFAASTGERHPTDLAGLRGARLVTATETEEGRRLAEARVKALTGGDRISARFMRQDFFEFQPQLNSSSLAITGRDLGRLTKPYGADSILYQRPSVLTRWRFPSRC